MSGVQSWFIVTWAWEVSQYTKNKITLHSVWSTFTLSFREMFSPCLNVFFLLISNSKLMNARTAKTFVTKMQTAPILLGFIIAPAKKDLLGMDARAQVN